MLQQFKQATSGIVGGVLLVLIVISFSVWGIADYLNGGGGGTAAVKVNGETISLQDIANQYENQKAAYQQQFGDRITDDMLLAIGVPQNILQNNIQNAIVMQQPDKLKLGSSPKAMRNQIAKIPLFNDANGFNKDIYKRQLSNRNYTPEQFERELAADIKMRQLEDLFNINYSDENTIKRLALLEFTTVDLAYVTLSPSAVPTPKEDKKAIETFYNEHKGNYIIPEKRDIAVLTLSTDALEKNIKPTTEELKNFYNENTNYFATTEQRKLRYFIAPEAELETIHSALSKDASQYNTFYNKFNGTNLGFVSGQDVLPQVAASAFALPEGDISKAVPTPLGNMFIKVDSIKAPTTPALADIQSKVTETYKNTKAEEQYYNTLERVEDMLAGGQTVMQIAEALELPLNTYNNIPADWATTTQEQKLAPQILEIAYNLPPQGTSSAIDEGETAKTYVSVISISPQTQLSLEDAFTKVKSDWQKMVTAQRLVESARELIAQGDISSNRKAKRIDGLNRTGTNADVNWLQVNLMRNLFTQLPGYVYPNPVQVGDNVLVVQLVNRNEKTADAETLSRTMQSYNALIQQELQQQYVQAAYTNARINYNIGQLQRVFGPNFTEDMLRTHKGL